MATIVERNALSMWRWLLFAAVAGLILGSVATGLIGWQIRSGSETVAPRTQAPSQSQGSVADGLRKQGLADRLGNEGLAERLRGKYFSPDTLRERNYVPVAPE